MEERVADLERENEKLRQTLQPPAPAPTERQDEDAEPPKPKAEPPTPKAECLLASVPRKELSACVLANGFCVGSETECTDLGGRCFGMVVSSVIHSTAYRTALSLG